MIPSSILYSSKFYQINKPQKILDVFSLSLIKYQQYLVFVDGFHDNGTLLWTFNV